MCGEKMMKAGSNCAMLGSPPRMRGKVQCVRRFLLAAVGSPPRMRGKVLCVSFFQFPFGITPAYAGKSSISCRWRSGRRDHPRVCGEKCLAVSTARWIPGSPPRMRGKEAGHPVSCLAHRITPAYAGKSTSGMLFLSCSWDHPRVCGEKLRKTAVSVRELGSPPRMRGKGSFVLLLGELIRITPACAGKR